MVVSKWFTNDGYQRVPILWAVFQVLGSQLNWPVHTTSSAKCVNAKLADQRCLPKVPCTLMCVLSSELWISSSVPNGTLMHFYDLWCRHFLMRLYLKKLKLCVNHIHVGIFYEPPINPVMNWNSLLCIGSSVLINVSVTFFWWLNVEYLM